MRPAPTTNGLPPCTGAYGPLYKGLDTKGIIVPQHMKIATCCYCGTRAALVLNKVWHELACGSCGAPLREMKRMPQRASQPVKAVSDRGVAAARSGKSRSRSTRKYDPQKSRERRKSFRKKLFEELWDVVEDIFD